MLLSPTLQASIIQKLSQKGFAKGKAEFRRISGGSINETYRISFTESDIFCKVNSASKFPQLFKKEQEGLGLIEQQNVIKVPTVVSCDEHEGAQVLLLEWVQESERTAGFWKKLGERLAYFHNKSDSSHGLTGDNYMGRVPQSNNRHSGWADFLVHERLAPMVNRCSEKGLLTKSQVSQFESIYLKLDSIFGSTTPSLLHGDLWSGNFMCDSNHEPVLIDPAVYYGHRSVDLAMTTLFGGFHQLFYEAYNYHSPFPGNHKEQWAVCNLYPLLIHLYLFGKSYLPQIQNTLSDFQ